MSRVIDETWSKLLREPSASNSRSELGEQPTRLLLFSAMEIVLVKFHRE